MISGILIIICSLVIVALIPLYLPNHSVEIDTSTSKQTRMLLLTSIFHLSCFFQNISVTNVWLLQYATDYQGDQTRAVIQANKQALSQSVRQTLRMSKIEKEIELFG